MAVSDFKQGRPLVLAIVTNSRDVLEVRVARVLSGSLKTGIYLRQPHGVAVPTDGYLELGDLRLAWLDDEVRWPQPVDRDAALALYEAVLIRDQSILNYAP
jgi:hypothetical protein